MRLLKSDKPETDDEKKMRSINSWYFVLVVFIIIWVIGAYVYLDKKADMSLNHPPVVVLDSADGIMLSNMFKVSGTNMQLFPPTSKQEMFEVREKYQFGDVVVVKFFYVEAVVLEKSATSDQYTVMYKDHNHALQKISLPRTMLMYPRDGVLNPVSLLVD